MAAKKKSKPRPVAPPAPATPPGPAPRPSLARWGWAELRQSPALAMALVFLILTCFAIAAVIQFRDNMEMGAIREPTGSIFLAAITITLFASYWRHRRATPAP